MSDTPLTVYVIGAGFSKALGYPLTAELLSIVPRIDILGRIFEFHYPRWEGAPNVEPDIEQFLTALDANRELLPAIPRSPAFTPSCSKRLVTHSC